MNIESIVQKSDLFKELVINSGFKRDVIDYYNSIQQAQNHNLIFMKDLSNRIISSLEFFEQNNLDKELELILKDEESFLSLEIKEKLLYLNNDIEINGKIYFTEFNQILKLLNQSISKNETEINLILGFCSKYTNSVILNNNSNKAIVSLIFKDLKSTKTIKGFSKVLNKWNTILITYHTILESDSPTEIELETIQSGSIDVIFNFNFDIALNLTEVFKYGMLTFGSYMAYKLKLKQEIMDIYDDNSELKQLEEHKEKLMLSHIKEKIKIKIKEQHEKHLLKNGSIDTTSIDKKIDNVSSLITEHIIKGNEFKLLSTIGENEEENEEEQMKKELRIATAKVKLGYAELSESDKQLMIGMYETKDDLE